MNIPLIILGIIVGGLIIFAGIKGWSLKEINFGILKWDSKESTSSIPSSTHSGSGDNITGDKKIAGDSVGGDKNTYYITQGETKSHTVANLKITTKGAKHQWEENIQEFRYRDLLTVTGKPLPEFKKPPLIRFFSDDLLSFQMVENTKDYFRVVAFNHTQMTIQGASPPTREYLFNLDITEQE